MNMDITKNCIESCDIFIIGGGINGVGVAADAAGRGLSVVLCEQDDLASATSSASSKLIHGGLRYLEQYDFRLVREALKEQQILLKRAPHLVQPQEFILPYSRLLRPKWLIQLGLFLYDHLARRNSLPSSKKIKFTAQNPLQSDYKVGFSYFDAKTDDARLVIANAQAAKLQGAKILTRTRFLSAKRQDDHWLIELLERNSHQKILIKAKAIINAAGPWANKVNQHILNIKTNSTLKLVKGSHIIVPKLYSGSQAYLLQNTDQRVVFVIPYQDQFSLIGTTDVTFAEDPASVHIVDAEIHYLCEVVNRYFKSAVMPDDVVWSYSGVRALYDGSTQPPSKISREYHFDLDEKDNLPMLTIIGGKLTTYRALAEHVLEKLKPYFPTMGSPWTEKAFLPGGDLGGQSMAEFTVRLKQDYPFLTNSLAQRYANSYGSLAYELLKDAKSIADLGENHGAELYEREVQYLIQNEWAQTFEDILWRRTKLGLFLRCQTPLMVSDTDGSNCLRCQTP